MTERSVSIKVLHTNTRCSIAHVSIATKTATHNKQIPDSLSAKVLPPLDDAPFKSSLPDPSGVERSVTVVVLRVPGVESSSEEGRSDGRAGSRKTSAKSSSPSRQGPQHCPVCAKIFGNASALAKHKLTHSDERRYVCTTCAKAFKRQDHLNGHMLTHRNKKPFECKSEGCGKSYCDARSLRRHTENHHGGSSCSNSSPEPSPPSCIQYAPPSAENKVIPGKTQKSSETVLKKQSDHGKKSAQKTKNAKTAEGLTDAISSSVGNATTSTTKTTWTPQANQPPSKTIHSSSKAVECNLCHRKFKNIPALNGHMRLHGGYFKKDSDPRRYERRDLNSSPLQTASISVRALIEEKIILKRITKPSTATCRGQTGFEEPLEDKVKIEPGVSDNSVGFDHPIIKKVSKIGVKRTISDPGVLKKNGSHLAAEIHGDHTPFTIDEYNDETEILSSSLQGDVFNDVQDGPDPLLLEGVDSNSIEESINAADLEDISLIEDYNSVGESLSSPQSFPHHQDVQSVLDSPLPANLAEFAYDHSENPGSQRNSPNYSSSSLSPADGGYSCTSLAQSSIFSSHSSKIYSASTSYYSSHITSTSGDTMRPSRPISSAQGSSLQSQMMPNSDDPLLSSNPKDFTPRRRFDFSSLKHLQSSSLDDMSSDQNVTGIVLDRNGELKVVHAGPSQSSKRPSVGQKNSGSFSNIKLESGKTPNKTFKTCKSNLRKHDEKIGPVLVDSIKKEEIDQDEVFVTPSISMTPIHLLRKRPRTENNQPKAHRSRLRHVRKYYGTTPLHYTPPPLLSPSRQGQGLYWQAVTSSPSSTTLCKGSNWDEIVETPESDSRPHVNIGPEYQCIIPDIVTSQGGKNKIKEQSLWESNLGKVVSDIEVEKYLEFACCAAIPGGGRNKEHALHLLHICHGQIQEAMLQLMQPTPLLPIGHSLLTFEYADSEKWTFSEIEKFHQALLKYDKDFPAVAREVGSKSYKQCVQFYYMWKKVCPDDYKKFRLLRKKYRESGSDGESSKTDNQNGEADIVTTTSSSEGRLFVCEYSDCSASFNSRAALNGHIRIHVGGTASRCGTPDKRNPLQVTESMEEFPCKLCGKVFNKVKSRSAHMKSHRPPETEIKKLKPDQSKNDQELPLSNRITTVSSSLTTKKKN